MILCIQIQNDCSHLTKLNQNFNRSTTLVWVQCLPVYKLKDIRVIPDNAKRDRLTACLPDLHNFINQIIH